MSYYLGIDIGTTSVKAVAFSQEGRIIAKENIGYELYHPQPGWSEQNPQEILQATISSITSILSKLNNAPAFISFSAAMHSLLAVDEQGTALSPCIIWADNRAAAIAEKLRSSPAGQLFYQDTGVPVHAMSPLCKLLWLKENDQALFSSAYKFIGIKEYILFHLTNKFIVDTSIASATGLLNLTSLQWHQPVLDYIGISSEQLPQIAAPLFTVYSNEQSTYLKGIPLIIGASDGALANVGSDATADDTVAVTIGTSTAVRRILPYIYTDEQMRTFCYHLSDQQYVVGGGGNSGAVILQWLKDTVLKTSQSYEALFAAAENIPAGSEGLLFLPYLLGERAPIWNAYAKGVFFGIDIRHTQAHFVRAVMEGIIYSVYSIGEILLKQKDINTIYATGGFTQSAAWVQMLSDMFNKTVIVSAAAESSALGAVKLGLEALQITQSRSAEMTAVYKPNEANHIIYYERFQKFERIYSLLKNEMSTPV
ncbi:MAG: gluconokinase [Agriterribacter sp.]